MCLSSFVESTQSIPPAAPIRPSTIVALSPILPWMPSPPAPAMPCTVSRHRVCLYSLRWHGNLRFAIHGSAPCPAPRGQTGFLHSPHLLAVSTTAPPRPKLFSGKQRMVSSFRTGAFLTPLVNRGGASTQETRFLPSHTL